MEISNLLEITPELKREILWTLRTAKTLENHLKGQSYSINVSSGGAAKLIIYDRHEGELGFYTHDFEVNGDYEFDFVNSGNTPESEMYKKAFLKEFNPRNYKIFYPDESEDSE